MDAAIIAIGTAVPQYKRQQKIVAETIANALRLNPQEKRMLKAIYRATGIEYRYSVLSDFCKGPGEYDFFPNDPNERFPGTAARMTVYKDNALHLALNAIEEALSPLKNFSHENITHVITVSCTGMYAPGLDIEIVQHLKLTANTKRTCINFMGCYGAFNAIKIADAICKADTNAIVLIVSVELCSLHFQKNDAMDNVVSNAIFADGAAALLIQAKPKTKKYLNLKSFHCDLLPQNSKDMAWSIADHGFDIVLSTYVSQAIESGIAEFAQRLLNPNQMTLADVDFYAIHPGGYKILKACEKALSITKEQNKYAYYVLQQFGNMSSATIVFVLKEIWKEINQNDTEKKIFSCAFGPGLTIETMLLEIRA